MPIRILPPELASQIAAGEVVERPASVVKELVENALDAGASYIRILVQKGGQRLVEVSDNGQGIPAAEIHLAVERHATSKIEHAQDLEKITSLGFRGEALAAIASVSHLTIISRSAEEVVGTRLRVDGGKIIEKTTIGAAPGCMVRVEDLFYNLPARLKFLKSENTERRQIRTLVTRYALAYPFVRFHLTQEGDEALLTSGNGDRREVLSLLYGREVARQMIEVFSELGEISIQGYVSPPGLTRANRREMHFFVNHRPVQDVSLASALLKAYHSLLMSQRYPLAALFVNLPAEAVDVNVHPTKAEVRFRQPDQVFTSLQSAVRRALLAHRAPESMSNIPRWMPQGSWQAPLPTTPTHSDQRPAWESQVNTEREPHTPENVSQVEMAAPRLPLLRAVGQVANAYLVAEGPDGLYLIDQHAAHERVLYERWLSQQSQVISQSLLQPASVELPPADAEIIEEQLPLLNKLGFSIEAFGRNTFLVRAIPALLGDIDPQSALRALVEDFEEDETPLKGAQEGRLVARICKRAAIKAGQSLTPEEQEALLMDLERCASPRTCPHGRPTMIHLSVDLLERQFGRRGAR